MEQDQTHGAARLSESAGREGVKEGEKVAQAPPEGRLGGRLLVGGYPLRGAARLVKPRLCHCLERLLVRLGRFGTVL